MYWLLMYELVDDYMERRRPLRERHLALARVSRGRGELVMAGALADPPDGAVLVFRAKDRAVVESFVAADPYVREGLVSSWWIRPWTVVVGGDSGSEAPVATPEPAPDPDAAPRRRRDAPLRPSS